MASDAITVFRNCKLLRGHALVNEDLWIRHGRVIDPRLVFFEELRNYDQEIDCKGSILAPGLIDLQINGGFGVDFTYDIRDEATAKVGLGKVAKGILQHGVTAFCPTIVTSASEIYHRVLPWLGPKKGGKNGAEILGAHIEGPFISKQKKGAHNVDFIRDFNDDGPAIFDAMYGPTVASSACIVTLAPELDPEGRVVRACTKRGITVSVGHSAGTLEDGERAVREGARLITHLFNAMLSFHHRDPGLIGMLTSIRLNDNPIYYGIIADGIHTHPAALRIAYQTNFQKLCLVTDAISPMGLGEGTHRLGDQAITVVGHRVTIAGTETLCGAIATMWRAVQKLMRGARCSLVEALETASLHPAQAIGLEGKKGSLDFGADADFILIDQGKMEIQSTWIAGNCVFKKN